MKPSRLVRSQKVRRFSHNRLAQLCVGVALFVGAADINAAGYWAEQPVGGPVQSDDPQSTAPATRAAAQTSTPSAAPQSNTPQSSTPQASPPAQVVEVGKDKPPKPPPQATIDPLDGHEVEWEGWRFRWQFRDIEGLILTDVHFQGRRLLKSIGLAEIYVPYATGWPRPQDFALGGFRANPMPLEIGRDCLPGSVGCKAFNRTGQRATEKTADMMMHEEPLGLMYAGTQGRATGKMLVLWSMAHFPGPGDGYTYIIRWKLQSDGALMGEVGATGGLQHLGVGAGTGRGVVVGRDAQGEVFAPSHVHNFYFRIDLDIESADNNAVEEFNYENDPDDPLKSRPTWQRMLLERGRYLNETTFRSWRVINTKSLNAQGRPRSYQLLPGGMGSWRDGLPNKLLTGDFFVTRYRETEQPYTASDQRQMLDALTAYMNDEPVDGADVVVWYRLAFAHHPRSEEWSAQPVVWHHFQLIPRDFLDASPLKASK